ncbi:dopamine beta-hydroxylase [Brachionus plicatilis]|uniref:Dopamine beta-hydroxylase n=1 Tax=Brachionus plicatilis TaxID=10195 RepID=A0A3M7PY34_BRAPC|nr:dopamine beta-hydroxylase [Brachionus plicatilis]
MIILDFISKNHREKSGLKFKFTKNLRKYDLGVLSIAVPTNQLDIVIPPRTDSVKLTSICYPECTKNYIPEDGITVFAGNLHTHLAGRAVRTKLGDSLILECTYGSKNRNKFTLGGFGTSDEMCINFIYYYPKIDFLGCQSTKLNEDLEKFYKNNSLMPIGTTLNGSVRNNSKLIGDHLTKLKPSRQLIERIKNFYENSDFHIGACAGDKNSSIFLTEKKEFLKPDKVFAEKKYC